MHQCHKPVSIELYNLDKGYGVFSKSDYYTKKHAHYAIEIVCCSEGSFNVETNHHHYTGLNNVIIPPNLRHNFNCSNATCELLFLDPLSAMGRYFMQQFKLASLKDVRVDIPELHRFLENGKFNISEILNHAEKCVAGNIDDRILNCVQQIDTLFTSDKVTVSQLSEIAYLSESRFTHLFKKETGISVHQYLLWKKISLAVLRSREGYSLTACAHYVGFADSSHFNRAFYKMFGLKPFFVLKS